MKLGNMKISDTLGGAPNFRMPSSVPNLLEDAADFGDGNTKVFVIAVVDKANDATLINNHRAEGIAPLVRREVEILDYLCDGRRNKRIG